jgi:hypothetical protein
MIGCLILGTFAAVGAAKLIRYRRMGWAGCHGGGWHDSWRGHGHERHGHEGYGHGHGRGGGFWGWGQMDHGGGGGGGDGGGDVAGADGGDGPSFGAEWGGGRGRGHHHGFGRRRDFILEAVLEHVRATPTQERAVKAAVGEFRDEVKRAAGGEGKQTRLDLASALRKPALDEVLLGELFARHDTALEGTRKAFVGLMAKIHDALDDEQRGRLAELMEKGPRFWRRGFDW